MWPSARWVDTCRPSRLATCAWKSPGRQAVPLKNRTVPTDCYGKISMFNGKTHYKSWNTWFIMGNLCSIIYHRKNSWLVYGWFGWPSGNLLHSYWSHGHRNSVFPLKSMIAWSFSSLPCSKLPEGNWDAHPTVAQWIQRGESGLKLKKFWSSPEHLRDWSCKFYKSIGSGERKILDSTRDGPSTVELYTSTAGIQGAQICKDDVLTRPKASGNEENIQDHPSII